MRSRSTIYSQLCGFQTPLSNASEVMQKNEMQVRLMRLCECTIFM